MDETGIERILKKGFSPSDEAAEELLQRCIAVLGQDDEIAEIDDERLEMLAAAGDPSVAFGGLRGE